MSVLKMKTKTKMNNKTCVNMKGEINMRETFEKICKMTQKDLKTYVTKELVKTHGKAYVSDGYVYAQGTFPVLLLAHMDTVHKKLPNVILCDEKDGSLSSPNGIGGDDRCGVFMILEIIKTYNCSVLFCEDEEIGGIGAKKFIQTDLAKELQFNYAIEFDRKGKNDAVFYDCDNEEFEDFITKDFYRTAYGSFSDISVVAPFLKCAAVNLSCGYYNAHTTQEYVVITEMMESINQASKILERTTEKDKFEYVEAAYQNYYRGNYGYYGSYYGYEDDYYYDGYGRYGQYYGGKGLKDSKKGKKTDEIYWVIEYLNMRGETEWYDTMAVSQAEAIGKFCMEFSNLSYGDIVDMMYDEDYIK